MSVRPFTLATAVTIFAGASLGCGPSAKDAQDAMTTLSATEGVSGGDVWRLLYKGCSEIKRCADGCTKEMEMCADGTTDESQCATLLASCSRDARSSASAGVAGRAWFAGHFSKFLGEVQPKVKYEDRAIFETRRANLKLDKVAGTKTKRP